MKRQKVNIEVSAWREEDLWVVHVVRPRTDTHIAFGNCVARRNVGRTAVSTAARALNVDASQIKLTKVDYIGSHRG